MLLKIGDTCTFIGGCTLDGKAADMRGWSVALTLKKQGCEGAVEHTLATEWVDIAAGKLRVFIDRALSESLSAGDYEVVSTMTSADETLTTGSAIIKVYA